MRRKREREREQSEPQEHHGISDKCATITTRSSSRRSADRPPSADAFAFKLFLSGGDFETGHPSRDRRTRGGTVSPRFPPLPDKRDSRKDVTRDHRSMDPLKCVANIGKKVADIRSACWN